MILRRVLPVAASALLLVGCATSPVPSPPPSSPPPTASPGEPRDGDGVSIVEDVDFGGAGDVRLDVCLPSSQGAELRPAILSVHGGGWSGGDKAEPQWRESCQWLASEGFVVFQTNYSLAPQHPFPAGLDDVHAALDWIAEDEQAARYGYAPSRIGAFGDSAGGNLVSLLGTRGVEGSEGAPRLSAVVELSAPLDLTEEGISLGELDVGFQGVQLSYLGCASYDDCPSARDASPMYFVDSTDPPFFIVHSTDEFIPVEQARAFVDLLEEADVDVTYTEVPGPAHALDVLNDDVRTSIVQWLHRQLAI